jgi:hypothetical protein
MEDEKKKPEAQEPVIVEEQIRQRAYQLYEQRGKEDGRDVEDWLRAEEEVAQKTRGTAA